MSGDSLNPGVDLGQIEGGFVQGIGWLTREELLWDKQGRLLTHSASTYQIPAISDAPLEMNVTLLPKAAQAGTIHGSKAVGRASAHARLLACVRHPRRGGRVWDAGRRGAARVAGDGRGDIRGHSIESCCGS